MGISYQMPGKYKIQGKRIAERREELGYSQEELAILLDTSQTQVSRWERGDMLPSGRYMGKLTLHLDVDADYILLRQDDKKRRRGDEISKEEAELLNALAVGDGIRVIQLVNTLIKKR